MAISWYSISISPQSGGGAIFNGYFSVDNTTNIIQTFYNANNINVNILAHTGDDYGADYKFINNEFTYLGTTITSIPALDVIYNASEWSLWIANNLSYKNGTTWIDLPTGEYIYSFTPIPDPSCFNEGTKILCLNKNLEEEYIPIENLRKGNLVKSYKHGYRKIDLIGKNPMINNPDKFNECMYKMEKTEDNGLIEDLIVTGGHAILVDDLGICKEENYKIFGTTHMIDDKYLLLSAVSKEFVKLENTNLYTYYHFILENNGNDDERFGVWANGILTETPPKNQFNNHKFTLL